MTKALIFDTETTDKDEPELIEAAWIQVQCVNDIAGESDRIPAPFWLDKSFVQRYRPSKAITYGAMAVHHILPVELEDCEPSDSFALPAGVDYLIGHNIDFDWGVIGKPGLVKRICTDAMARYIWQDADSYSQSALLYMTCGASPKVRYWLKDAHSALADVENCARLLEQILVAKPEIETWAALHVYSEACRIPRVMPFGKARGELLTDLVGSDFGYCQWLLNQDWIDPYLRAGINKAMNPTNDDSPF